MLALAPKFYKHKRELRGSAEMFHPKVHTVSIMFDNTDITGTRLLALAPTFDLLYSVS